MKRLAAALPLLLLASCVFDGAPPRPVTGRWVGYAVPSYAPGPISLAGPLWLSVTDSTASVTFGDGANGRLSGRGPWEGRIVGVTDSAATFWTSLSTFGETSIHLTLDSEGRLQGLIMPEVGRVSALAGGSWGAGSGLVRVPDSVQDPFAMP